MYAKVWTIKMINEAVFFKKCAAFQIFRIVKSERPKWFMNTKVAKGCVTRAQSNKYG